MTEILGLVDFIQEVNVYGVEIPGILSISDIYILLISIGNTSIKSIKTVTIFGLIVSHYNLGSITSVNNS